MSKAPHFDLNPSAAKALDGPQWLPQGAVKKAVVFLHGFGSDGDDLIALAPHFADSLKETAFFAPNGPSLTQMGIGYQWFSDNGWTFNDEPGMQQTLAKMQEYLEKVVFSLGKGLTYADVALVGFSQGTMMSLYAAPRLKEPLAAVVGFSGRMMWDEKLPKTGIAKMPVLLVHGQEDDVVTAESSLEAEKRLKQRGFPVEAHVLAGLAHGIDGRGIALAQEFLAQCLAS